ncbi:MAG: MotA/TolQ/ExbB proton channel family protein [Thermoguttaceae bacterium]
MEINELTTLPSLPSNPFWLLMETLFTKRPSIRLAAFFLILFAVFHFPFCEVNCNSLSVAFAQEEVEVEINAGDPAAGGASAATNSSDPDNESYLFWYMNALGPLFAPVFAILSVILVMLIVMNGMSITRNNMMPPSLVDQFRIKIDEEQFQEAYELAKTNDSSQGRILAAGLAKMTGGYDAASQAMGDVAEEEIMRMEQKLGYVGMIAGIAPMVGLLGTVFGMVASFNVIARSGTAPQASELASGISTALVTTQFGLLIAIPAIIFYELFRNKLSLLVLELNVQTENLMSRFKTGG